MTLVLGAKSGGDLTRAGFTGAACLNRCREPSVGLRLRRSCGWRLCMCGWRLWNAVVEVAADDGPSASRSKS